MVIIVLVLGSIKVGFELNFEKFKLHCGYQPKKVHVGTQGVTVQSQASILKETSRARNDRANDRTSDRKD